MLALLAHTIADGFGASDVSGFVDSDNLKAGLEDLLRDLIWERTVIWDTWFIIASCTFLGCPWSLNMIPQDDGASSVVVAQYRSLVAASNWIDLSQELSISGCFGFSPAQGQIQGVVGDFAIIQAEETMEQSEHDVSSLEILETPSAASTLDSSIAYVETAIIGASPTHRLLTMVRSDTVRRIVDPTAAMIALFNSYAPRCEHSDTIDVLSDTSNSLETFDELLGEWGPENASKQDGKSVVTQTMSTVEKFNVALSLSPQGCIIQGPQCCLNCAKAVLVQHPSKRGKRIIRQKNAGRPMQQLTF